MSFEIIPLNLPTCSLKLSEKEGQVFVFDEIRKKKLVLTPEEWVRQHFIHFLVNEKNVPKAFISIENGLVLNNLQRRSDIVVFNRSGAPLLIVECKAPKMILQQQTMDQVMTYNMVKNCKWLVLTNGILHVYAQVQNQKLVYLPVLPNFENW